MANTNRFTRPLSGYPTEFAIDPRCKIRVVDILPGYALDDLHCHISIRSLKSNTLWDFDALSYAWGDWEGHARIVLNGIDFPVTANLYYALRRLRRTNQPRRLWIDQISMDQRCYCDSAKHTCEAMLQVPLMGEIYKRARRVIIWLGDNEDHMITPGGPGNVAAYKTLKATFSKRLSDHSSNTSSIPEWWTRSWVLQEFASANKEPLVMFGEHEMEWYMLGSLLQEKRALPTDEWSIRSLQMKQYDVLRQDTTKNNTHALTILLRHTDTHLPQDKINCILSLLREAERKLIPLPESKPTVSEVFSVATYASIVSTGTLGIMSLVPRLSSTNPHQVPSWTVDFTFSDEGNRIAKYQFPKSSKRETMLEWMYRPIQTNEADFSLKLYNFVNYQKSWCRKYPRKRAHVVLNHEEYQKITLTGLQFDIVGEIADVNRGVIRNAEPGTGHIETIIEGFVPTSKSNIVSWIDTKLMHGVERSFQSIFQQRVFRCNPYHRVGSRTQKIPPQLGLDEKRPAVRMMMTKALFRQWDKCARPKAAKEIFDRNYRSLFKLVYQHHLTDNSTLRQGGGEGNKNKSVDPHFDALHASYLRMYLETDSRDLSFFITAAGFTGLGPADLRPDDKIILPYGSRLPIAVRQSEDDCWLFVRFLYVRGIMHDELWDCFPDIELPEIGILLR